VPIIRDGKYVVFEMNDDSQVIAKYLDEKLHLGLFSGSLEGVQSILWRNIENEIEGAASGLTTFTGRKTCPRRSSCNFCGSRNASLAAAASTSGASSKVPGLRNWSRDCCRSRRCWRTNSFLLGEEPCFVDFDLFGMLENFLHSGHYELPATYPHIKEWHSRMAGLKIQRAK
jgi:glutathione S-transferase